MEKLKTGIIGLDGMLGDGIPKGHIMTVIGPPGTGKSTFGLQFIYEGLKNGESCVYLSLEEGEDEIIETAEAFGWNIKPYIENKKLGLIRLSPQNIKVTIERIEDNLPKLLKSFDVKRLVIDPITLYEMIYDSEPERRDRVFNFTHTIKKTGITVILTSVTNDTNPYSSKYGLIEYVADGVIILRHVRQADYRTVTTFLEILKMRRVEHSKEIRPYNITKQGIIVHTEASVFI